jgi:hypothetical protein
MDLRGRTWRMEMVLLECDIRCYGKLTGKVSL